jgi:hypothetical protein
MDLLPLARKYIWWQSPEYTLRDRHRLIAQVMDIGTHSDVEALRTALGDDALRHALQTARAGEFSARSWHYWYVILELATHHTVPALPERKQSQPNTLTVLTAGRDTDRVKISFFGGLKFGRLAPPRKAPDGVMKVASLPDLLAHKLKTVLQRVEPKDYLDIDALVQSGLSLSSGLAGANLLFPAFSPQECLKALVYFQDETLRDLPAELQGRLLNAVKRVRSIPPAALDSPALSD